MNKKHFCIICGNYDPQQIYFEIPDNQRRKIWLERCGIAGDFVLPKRAKICRLHFADDAFAECGNSVNSRFRLKKQAAPSIRVNASELKYCRLRPSPKRKRHPCFSCGSLKNSENYSLFKFPSSIQQRKKWLEQLGLENVPPPSFESRLCSKHFNQSDILGNPNVTKRIRLRANAVPFKLTDMNQCNETEELISNYSETNMPNMDENEFRETEDLVLNSPERNTSNSEVNEHNDIEEMVFNFPETNSENTDQNLPSLCSTPRNGELNELWEDHNYSTVRRRRIKLEEPRYVGDIRSHHFSTPKRARRTLAMIKTKYYSQQKQIQALKQQLQHAKKTVNTMRNLIRQLKEKQKITESASNLLELNTDCNSNNGLRISNEVNQLPKIIRTSKPKRVNKL